jgi:UDP-GlcNAc:undecaprenyl-phosphate GlcNAc-1-phosphate transferase
MATLATYFLLALALSLGLTPLCRSLAQRFGYVARPQHDRWHREPTALFGGVGIVVVVAALALTLKPQYQIWQLLGPGLLVAAFGFVDDVVSLKPSTKLIAQIVVASVLLFLGFRLDWTRSLVFDAMLTLLWVVGISNAFNLLDNMDGLCAGVVLVAGSFLLVGLQNDGAAPSTAYLAALLGATAGFLVYNVHPASIFMGDTGSLFLGFNLAALTLIDRPDSPGKSGLLSVVAAPVLLLLVPIFDTTLVTAMRLLSGRRPSQGGRDHTSHRLVALGLSEPWAVATLCGLAAAGGAISLLLQRRSATALVVALMFLLAMVIFAVYLGGVRVYEDRDLAGRETSKMTPLISNLMYKQRIAEVMLDLCLIPIAYYAAYRLRFEGGLFAANYSVFIQSLPVVLAAQIVSLFIVGGYRGTWRQFGLADAVVFAKGVVLGTVAAQIVLLYIYRFESYSRAVFVIDAALLMLLLLGSRASFRLLAEFILRRTAVGRRCVIYGTGGASLGTVREAFGNDVTLKVAGYIDDDPLRLSQRVGGYTVLGNHAHLVGMIDREEVDCVVLNTNLVSIDLLQDLQHRCADHEVELLRLHVLVAPLPVAS